MSVSSITTKHIPKWNKWLYHLPRVQTDHSHFFSICELNNFGIVSKNEKKTRLSLEKIDTNDFLVLFLLFEYFLSTCKIIFLTVGVFIDCVGDTMDGLGPTPCPTAWQNGSCTVTWSNEYRLKGPIDDHYILSIPFWKALISTIPPTWSCWWWYLIAFIRRWHITPPAISPRLGRGCSTGSTLLRFLGNFDRACEQMLVNMN